MARLDAFVFCEELMPRQIQITHGIQYLVFHKLVVVAQATIIEDAIVINDDRVIHTAAAG